MVTYGEIRSAIEALRERGMTVAEIAAATDSGERSLYRYLSEGSRDEQAVQRGGTLLVQLQGLLQAESITPA